MVTWTANVDALLFKNILKLHAIKVNYEAVEKAMRAEGVDVSAKAITHRVAKLRNATNEEAEDGGKPLGQYVAKPRKTMAGDKRKAASEVKKAPKGVVEDGDAFADNNDAEDEKPAAKKKKTVKTETKKQAVVKDEAMEEEGI